MWVSADRLVHVTSLTQETSNSLLAWRCIVANTEIADMSLIRAQMFVLLFCLCCPFYVEACKM